ncbi:MAG: cupredoxin family copper-binding protein [Beijerinckiaceae bacterium]|nr:cupredoxin family copper-binding protein [Beijerinckiaceae bacterium]
MRDTIFLALGSLCFLAAAGLAYAADTQPASVTIDNFSFNQASLTVKAGTRVTWTNRDDIPHTVVDADDPKAMKSPPLDTGEQFEHTFAKAGTFHYFCSLHPHMQGTIVVQ